MVGGGGCEQICISLLTSEQTAAVVGEGVKDAVGRHEARVVQNPLAPVRLRRVRWERRKTGGKGEESGEDENFLSSEMARNREWVCDHRRNPEPQACTERGSHQETFERKERRDGAVESVRCCTTGVCRC